MNGYSGGVVAIPAQAGLHTIVASRRGTVSVRAPGWRFARHKPRSQAPAPDRIIIIREVYVSPLHPRPAKQKPRD